MSRNFCFATISRPRSLWTRNALHLLIVFSLLVSALSLFGEDTRSRSQSRIIVSAALAPAIAGIPYDTVVSVSGGLAPYRYEGQNLPTGLALDSSTGHISGIPQVVGTFSFSVEVFDSSGMHTFAKLKLPITSGERAVTVTLAPISVTVSSGASVQFQATVNRWNAAVIWTVSSGTVSSSGLYTAPVVTSNTTAVLTATSVADSTKSATANISVAAPIAITLSPTSSTLNSGAAAQFQASVSNTSNTGVNWTATIGTVSSSGLYNAPAVTTSTTATLTATSIADSTRSATATISISPPVSVAVSPVSTSVNSGAGAQFSATVTNTSNTAVNWTASAGTISSAGAYTAPAVTVNTTAVVTATSAADSTKSAVSTVTLIAPTVAVTVTPPTTTVNSGATAQFQASVTNTSNTGVTWTASPGTVSSSGMYTAPVVKANTTALITATSTADSSKSASANVSLVAATPKVALQVLFPPINPRTSDYKAVQAYLMNNPAVTGANLSVEWGMIDQGPTANPQYVWTAVDALIAPWAAAGKKVNLIVWANSDSSIATCSNGVASTTGNCAIPGYVWNLLGPSNYTSCNTQYGVQQIGNYLSQAGFQLPYQQFMSATVQKYGTNPNIGYIRFGLGHGGESFPVSGWNDITAACGQAFAAWGITIPSWESYLASMVAFESNLHSPKQLMVGVTPMGFPLSTVPDFLAPLVVPAGIGFGTQGFELADVTGYPTCNADWCNLFAHYAGQQPLELQTLLQSCPDNSCATGSLVDLIPFAISHHASVFEIYYQDWLLAFAPGYPGNSQYGAAYSQVLTNAANSNVQ